MADKPASINIVEAIQQHNAGRDPERLAMKYAKMRQSPFVFLRGACHLFYAALPADPVLDNAPLAWCCGDLHFENFGSYKADNRLVYFDINDYDEAALAPCTWDILRLLTSIACGAADLNATVAEALAVSHDCLDAYREELLHGKPLWVEAETAQGLVRDLFDSVQDRARADFLDRRTVKKAKQRSLRVDGVKALAATAEEKARVTEWVDRFAATQPHPGFFRVLDVARRIAGTGSLGVMRYVVLVEGKGSPDGNYLLDIKEASPSALTGVLQQRGIVQPAWSSEAERIVALQKRMQAVDHAFLYSLNAGGTPCVLRGLQPSEDRVAIGDWGKKLDHLRATVATMGRILAWDQLRASGRGGAVNADALIEFAARDDWRPALMEQAHDMLERTRAQWAEFCKSDL